MTHTDIAFRCGFNSSTDFSRSFKAACGAAPGGFDLAALEANRKKWKASPEHPEYAALLRMRKVRREFRVQVMARPAMTAAFLRVHNSYADGKVQTVFARKMEWARTRGFHRTGTLVGVSQDDPTITPREKCRYDVCYTVPEGTPRVSEIGIRGIRANRFATVHIHGDVRVLMAAYEYLFARWLPSGGYQQTHDPVVEIYVRTPEEVGWEVFDLLGCLPVRPLW